MDRDEIIAFLKENLTIEADFTAWSWGPNNELSVKLMLGDEAISTTRTTIDWHDSSKDDY